MKRLLFILVISIFACSEENVTPSKDTEKAISDLRKVSSDFTTKSNSFNFSLFQKVNSQAEPDENLLISPLSSNLALGMLLNGADGNTAEQIKNVLGWSDEDMNVVNENYKNIIISLPSLDNAVELGIANALWHHEPFTIKDNFLTTLDNKFDAEINAYDFNKAEAPEVINNWVENNTNGLIKKIIDKISPSEVMFLLNALYFKGDWTTQFDKSQTQKLPFKNINGITSEVEMMMLKEVDLDVSVRDEFTVFDLPYGDEVFSLAIVLPNKEESLEAVLKEINAEEWDSFDETKSSREVIVGLPKFELNYNITLNEVLKELGITDVFNASMSDLSQISEQQLNVSEVKHKTYMKVDEEGTEAAAVTSIGVEVTSIGDEPLILKCDRPFAFFIYEKELGNILFSGKIVSL